MRKYLFKGKRTDNEKWVVGNLIGETTIMPTGQHFTIDFDTDIMEPIDDYFYAYNVHPNTVKLLKVKKATARLKGAAKNDR